MVKKSHGLRIKSRHKLKKKIREKGINIRRAMQQFEEGQKVHIVIDPSVQKGAPHPRFHGRTGTVVGKRGWSYLVKIKDGNKEKMLVVRPEHLILQKGM
jgi:large subunit ribosomal protein L21e